MITIKDIAKMTNLSVSTVSRALNNHPAINENTRKMVMEYVERLHYIPNRTAQNLVNRKNHTIGFMIPDIADSFFSQAAIGVEEIMHQNQHDVIYATTNRESNRVLDFLTKAQEYRYSGVFITPDEWNDDLIRQIHNARMPVVSLRRKTPFTKPEIPYVDSDHYAGFKEATEYILSLGHKEIGLITAKTQIYIERQRGYETVMLSNNLTPHVLCFEQPIPSQKRYEAGYQAARKLLEEFPDITAIVATDDKFAIGAMEYLNEMSLDVPGDISILGCDHRPEGQLYPFRLTTIQQDILELGRTAANMMLRMLEDPNWQPVSVSLKPKLKVGRTTGPKRDFR